MKIGAYRELLEKKSLVRIKVDPQDLARVWKRCGITADYGARYLARADGEAKKMENSASMILNELIENAAKYSSDDAGSVELLIWASDDSIVFQVDNTSDAERFYVFRDFVEWLNSCDDVNRAYFEKLQSLCDGDQDKSGVGLMTIISFYNLSVGFKFQDLGNSEKYRISVQAAVPVKG